jgi:hypothetical protein
MLYTKLTELQEKLDKLCEDNDLEYSFSKEDFPIIFTFRPMWEKAAQMRLDLGESELTTDPDARIELVFGDELTLRSFGDFVIDDDQLNKIKNMAKKIHYLYLQLFFYKQKQIEKNQWNTGRNQVENQQISTDSQQIKTENKQDDTEETTDTEQMYNRKKGEKNGMA